MIQLSILIATVPDRQIPFDVLHYELSRQAKGLPVEIIVDDRARGTVSVGTKRQDLIDKAKGQYVVHIDDDDWVPPEYVSTVVHALESKPDCVGHYELVEGHGKVPQLSIWTKNAPRWMEGREAMRLHGVNYVRTPFHKTPLKTAHARAIGIHDLHFGEDHDFSKRLHAARLCRTEVFIPRVLYFYRYAHEQHNIKYGIK